MMEFLQVLTDPSIPFFRNALFVGLLASVAFGVIGTYVVARRITYLAGAISHCILGGIGAGLYLQKKVGLAWFDPIYGAIGAAILSAGILGIVSLRMKEREDSIIGALWAIGMAIGLIFIARTPGYTDPMSYLFGNILLITKADLWIVIGLDVLVAAITIFFYQAFLAVCFDEEFARLRGVRTEIYFLLLLCLTGLTIVLLVRIVGIVMVIALLTLPAAIASIFARRLWQMMLLAALGSMLFISSGLAVSYAGDLPSGPVIIIIAGAVYLVALLAKKRIA